MTYSNIKQEEGQKPKSQHLPDHLPVAASFNNKAGKRPMKEEIAKKVARNENEIDILAYQNLVYVYNHVAQYQTVCFICDQVLPQESIKVYCPECSEADQITVNLETYKPQKFNTEAGFPEYSGLTDDKLNGKKVRSQF